MNEELQPRAAYSAKSHFTFVTKIAAALAAAGSTQSNFQVAKDSDFFWQKLTVHAVVASDGTTYDAEVLPEVDVIITNTSSGRRYMNEQVPLACIAGTARLPFLLPMETFLPALTQIQVEYFNVSDAISYSALRLAFVGYKAFP